MKLPHTLDEEFKRVSKEEEVTMEELVAEVARLIGKSARQIYNFRSGRWPLPHTLIPVLCKRFRSNALLDALADECEETSVEVPEAYELTKLISQTVRNDLNHYERLLEAFDSDGIDRGELDDLRASGERVIQNVRQLEAIAVADYERRAAQKGR